MGVSRVPAGRLNYAAGAAARIFGADRVRAVAKEFEAVFLFLKQYVGRDVLRPPARRPHGRRGGRRYLARSLLTDAYTKTVANSGGIGLADHGQRQFIA
jgi:Rod binding domain-containing protein